MAEVWRLLQSEVRRAEKGGCPFELKLFGPFEARVGGQPLPALRSKKSKWALALLALRSDRDVARSWLAGTLWPESTEDRALSALRTTLKDVRRALGPEAWRLTAPSGGTIRLDLEAVDLDVASFDRAVENRDHLAAASLYRGQFLEGCSEDWAFSERDSREQQALAAFEALAQAAYQSGDFLLAESWIRKAVAIDPLRESAVRLLMLVCDAAGNTANTREAYRQYRTHLRRELRCEPGGELTALYSRLKEKAARASTLRELTVPPPQEFIIPQPLTGLIGRENELPQVEARVRLNRLVTLTGAGGVGKTRLALELADRMAPEFGWGACFIEFAGTSDSERVPEGVLTGLGFRTASHATSVDSLARALRHADVLLILDNCEHLLDACAKAIEKVLECCPGVKVLATSREPLGLSGEALWRVPSLEIPPPDEGRVDEENALEWAMRASALRLFVERAGQASATFALSAANLRTAQRICRRLDGIPLALEMAAARVSTMSLSEISQGLDKRFELLTQGSRTSLPRQQTLEAVMDWSYRLLSETERRLLRRLSVFAGGFFLESAEAVCEGEDLARESIAESVRSLDQKNLVEKTDSEFGPRYRLLESIREYGKRFLNEDDEIVRMHDRHLVHFAELAERIYVGFRTPEQPFWNRRSQMDLDNFRAALTWSFECAENGAIFQTLQALRLLGGLANPWQWQGHSIESLAWMERAILYSDKLLEDDVFGLDSNQKEEIKRRQIILLRCMGHRLEAMDEAQAAMDVLNRGLAAAVSVEDLHEEGWICIGLAMCYLRLGRLEDAQRDLQRSLEIAEDLQISHLLAITYDHAAFLAMAYGDLDCAEEHLRKAFDVATKLQNPSRVACATLWLSEAAMLRGNPDECIRLARESLRGLLDTGFLILTPYALEIAAAALVEFRNMSDASQLFGAADRLRKVLGKLRDRDPHRLRIFERAKGELRKSLADEFDRLFQKGTTLSLEQGVELALHAPLCATNDA